MVNLNQNLKRELDIAWAAGIIEGEGSFFTKDNRYKIAIEMTDLDVIQKLHKILGVGRIYTRQRHSKSGTTWKQTYNLTIYKKWDVYYTLILIMPYLCKRRYEKASEVYTKIKGSPNVKKMEIN